MIPTLSLSRSFQTDLFLDWSYFPIKDSVPNHTIDYFPARENRLKLA